MCNRRGSGGTLKVGRPRSAEIMRMLKDYPSPSTLSLSLPIVFIKDHKVKCGQVDGILGLVLEYCTRFEVPMSDLAGWQQCAHCRCNFASMLKHSVSGDPKVCDSKVVYYKPVPKRPAAKGRCSPNMSPAVRLYTAGVKRVRVAVHRRSSTSYWM